MAYLQELLRSQQQQIEQETRITAEQFGLPRGQAYSQYMPGWEVTTPQYQQPLPWSLASIGYKTNEVAYACIDLWMKTISEPNVKVYDKKTDEIIEDHPIVDFFDHPCPDLTESDFWKATMMYLKIAGFSAWEKDEKNNGSLNAIWPMMPQYCSFKRGQGKLLRAIQYQPYTGLPAIDIPRERIMLFMYPDPQYFGLRPFSPTAVLADIIGVDNDMTKMLQQFLKNGAFVSGLLSTDQVINEADARFAKERFRESHGGAHNAGDVVVTGKGMKFQPTNQTFREMVFPEVDARSETRICQGYSVKPILVSAKVGMDRATYNNYEQARQAWYDEEVTSEWEFLAQRVTRDLLPHFDKDPNHEVRFDIRKVRALEDARNKRDEKVVEQAKANLISRDEARIDLGKDEIDKTPVFVGLTTQQQLSETQDIFEVGGGEDKIDQGDETAYGKNEREKQEKLKLQREKAMTEEKAFRAFAKRRLKEEKPNDVGEFEFKHVDATRQRQLLTEFGVPDPAAEMVMKSLLAVVDELRRPQDIKVTAQMEKQDPPIVNVEAPNVTIENRIPEQKAVKLPAPVVNVSVEPTPVNVAAPIIENKIEVETPKVKRSYQKVKRDGGNNIEGTITEYEYDEGMSDGE